METEGTPKRKYKKRKEGFKIAVEHKLNTRVKPIYNDSNSSALYPVYVEVRAKRQNTFFKSRFILDSAVNSFDALREDPLIKMVLEREAKIIIESIQDYDDEFHGGFDMRGWYTRYSREVINSNCYVSMSGFLYSELEGLINERHPRFNLIKHVFNQVFSTYMGIEEVVIMLESFGVERLRSTLKAYESFENLFTWLKDCENAIFSNTSDSHVVIYHGLLEEELFSDFFEDYTNYLIYRVKSNNFNVDAYADLYRKTIISIQQSTVYNVFPKRLIDYSAYQNQQEK